jgi:glycosyltransferase involved in cell wall biosynthesis
VRILHVVAPASVGGLERVVHALASGQAGAGDEPMVAAVVTAEPPVRPWLAELRESGAAVKTLVVPGRAYLREWREIASLCRSFRPDVVHTHGFRPDVVSSPVAHRLGIPRVTTVHGLTGGDLRTRLYERIQRWAIGRFDAVVAVSQPLGRRLVEAGVPEQRLHVVPNAWSPAGEPLGREAARETLRLPADRFCVGWVGRLSREKGPDVALEALSLVADLPIDLSFVGDGALRAELERRSAALGLEHRVRWHGTVQGAARVVPGFDAWVLSSRTEGTPIALFEAMAAGVPIAATRVGGVPDVISGREALLVPPDDPAGLASAIRVLFHDRREALARAQRARRRLEAEHRPGPWLDRYRAIYRSLLPNPPSWT